MTLAARAFAPAPRHQPWTVNRPQTRVEPTPVLNTVTRRFDIQWLNADGTAGERTIVAPALPVFGEAFCAFAQGTLIQTEAGPVAVEDLQPGMMIATAEGRSQPLMWIGNMCVFPHEEAMGLRCNGIFRFTDGSYGHDRNAPDLLLGSSARIMPGLHATNSASELLEVCDLADGHSVIAIRPAVPVRVYHLALPAHRLMRANGVLVESYHPGEDADMHLSTEMFSMFMGMFPHLARLSDFGPLRHRRRG